MSRKRIRLSIKSERRAITARVKELPEVRRANRLADLLLAHNHSSGVAEPSQADELITHRLKDALALVDIRILDHLVVAGSDVVSFGEKGLL